MFAYAHVHDVLALSYSQCMSESQPSITESLCEYLTVNEVAAALKLNPQTVRNWITDGRLPALRVGQRRVRIRRPDLDAFLSQGPIEPPRGGNPSTTRSPNYSTRSRGCAPASNSSNAHRTLDAVSFRVGRGAPSSGVVVERHPIAVSWDLLQFRCRQPPPAPPLPAQL
jgi:excisionase family DNA binding protein